MNAPPRKSRPPRKTPCCAGRRGSKQHHFSHWTCFGIRPVAAHCICGQTWEITLQFTPARTLQPLEKKP